MSPYQDEQLSQKGGEGKTSKEPQSSVQKVGMAQHQYLSRISRISLLVATVCFGSLVNIGQGKLTSEGQFGKCSDQVKVERLKQCRCMRPCTIMKSRIGWFTQLKRCCRPGAKWYCRWRAQGFLSSQVQISWEIPVVTSFHCDFMMLIWRYSRPAWRLSCSTYSREAACSSRLGLMIFRGPFQLLVYDSAIPWLQCGSPISSIKTNPSHILKFSKPQNNFRNRWVLFV